MFRAVPSGGEGEGQGGGGVMTPARGGKNPHLRAQIELEQDKFLEAFPKFDLNISATCRAIGITRDQVGHWMRADERFKKLYAVIRDEELDTAENRMNTLIKKLDDPESNQKVLSVAWDANKFLLKTRHPDYRYQREAEPTKQLRPPNQILILLGGERTQIQDLAKNFMKQLQGGETPGVQEKEDDIL